MAILIHARLVASDEVTVTYQFESPPEPSSQVTIPCADPNAFNLADAAFAFAGQRVVARAASTFKKTGEWPQGFTIAS